MLANRLLTLQGLIDAVKMIFPTTYHRFCCRHIFVNFCRKFITLEIRKYFWMAARSTYRPEFWSTMKELKSKGEGKPFDYLVDIPHACWSRHAFSSTSKSEHYINNMSESFNS